MNCKLWDESDGGREADSWFGRGSGALFQGGKDLHLRGGAVQRGSLKRLYDRNEQISLPAEAPRRGERPAAVKKCLTKSGGADGGVDGDGSGRGRIGGSLARQVYLSSPSPHASFCEDLSLAARVRVNSRLPLNDSHFGPAPPAPAAAAEKRRARMERWEVGGALLPPSG